MDDIEVIKVELTEENLIKPKRIEFENGNCIIVRPDTSDKVYRGNIHRMFFD